MGWGGGFGGGMGGMGGGGQHGHSGNPGNGLPFAGIPSELQEGVDKLLLKEPDHGEYPVNFSHQDTEEEETKLTLRRLLLKHWRLGLYALFFVALVSIANQAGPTLVSLAINRGLGAHKDFGVIVVISVIYLAAVGLSAISQRQQVRATGRLSAMVMTDLEVKVFRHLQRLSLGFYTAEKAGVLMTRMTSDIQNLLMLLRDGLAQFIIQGLTMVVVAIILFVMNAHLALITFGLIVPILTVMSIWFRGASERAYQLVRDGIAGVLADLSESLHGVRVVTAHNRQRHNVVAHRNVVGQYMDANNYTAQINAIYGPGTQMLGFLGQGALLAIGGEMVLHHSLSLGDLVAFFLYLNRLLTPIQLLVQQYNTYQQGQSSIIKLRTLFVLEPEVKEAKGARDLPLVEGNISFEDVTFSYSPDAPPAIRDASLDIAAGETVAFVGATGAGKSTLAKLVTRFYDPTEGRVLIDGNDLKEVTLTSLRRQLGVVPQEPFLFGGTIRDNIAFADPDCPDDAVWEAIRAVGLVEVVERMPDGIETVVHERGQSLSSGERQLIALARAFLAKPRVLVLDEATSNLDLLSESKVEAALDVLLEARTAILIAHRLTTAMKADRIVVVDDGRIVEVGPHEELVAAGGRYADMYATWISHAEGHEAGDEAELGGGLMVQPAR